MLPHVCITQTYFLPLCVCVVWGCQHSGSALHGVGQGCAREQMVVAGWEGSRAQRQRAQQERCTSCGLGWVRTNKILMQGFFISLEYCIISLVGKVVSAAQCWWKMEACHMLVCWWKFDHGCISLCTVLHSRNTMADNSISWRLHNSLSLIIHCCDSRFIKVVQTSLSPVTCWWDAWSISPDSYWQLYPELLSDVWPSHPISRSLWRKPFFSCIYNLIVWLTCLHLQTTSDNVLKHLAVHVHITAAKQCFSCCYIALKTNCLALCNE